MMLDFCICGAEIEDVGDEYGEQIWWGTGMYPELCYPDSENERERKMTHEWYESV